MMERNELLRALRSTAADQHRCFGCGYEYKCSIRGCAINRAAAELIVQLAAENEALRHPTNPPLTLEELRERGGIALGRGTQMVLRAPAGGAAGEGVPEPAAQAVGQ